MPRVTNFTFSTILTLLLTLQLSPVCFLFVVKYNLSHYFTIIPFVSSHKVSWVSSFHCHTSIWCFPALLLLIFSSAVIISITCCQALFISFVFSSHTWVLSCDFRFFLSFFFSFFTLNSSNLWYNLCVKKGKTTV